MLRQERFRSQSVPRWQVPLAGRYFEGALTGMKGLYFRFEHQEGWGPFHQDDIAHKVILRSIHLDELAALRDEAKAEGQFSAAIRAEELRGRLCNLYEAPDEAQETRQRPSERPRTPEEEAHFRKILEPFARPVQPLEAEPIALKAIGSHNSQDGYRRVIEGRGDFDQWRKNATRITRFSELNR